jgi:uncharacterized delta-60 repeat protein
MRGKILFVLVCAIILAPVLSFYAEAAVTSLDGFDPDANDAVLVLAVQADGKVVLGGSFTSIAGTTRNRIARLNPDGSLDVDFNPDANYDVHVLAIQHDGKIVLGGIFTSINGHERKGIARLNPDGSLDASFTASLGPEALAVCIC